MFSKRKKNYKVFVVTALIIAICVLIVAILWPTEPSNDNPTNSSIENPIDNGTNSLTNKPASKDALIDEPDNATDNTNNLNDQESRTPADSQTYYMVKKSGQIISVYFITETGEKMKLEDTEILYDLLPLEDQAKFDEGIIVENQEALYSLLQDFEG